MRADVVVFITLPASALRKEPLVNNNEETPSWTRGTRMGVYFAKYQLAIQLYHQLAIDFPRALIPSADETWALIDILSFSYGARAKEVAARRKDVGRRLYRGGG